MEYRADVITSGIRVKERRRKNYSLVYITVFVVVLIIFTVLSCTVLFPIKTIAVDGSSVYSADDIAKASGVPDGQPLLTLRSGKVQNLVSDSFIYIDNVSVKKSFPNTLTIEIVPSSPVASIQTADGYLYLSAGGKLLELNPEPKKDTLIFTGVNLSPAALPGSMVSLNPNDSSLTDEEKADSAIIVELLEVADGDLGGLRPKTNYVDLSDPGDIRIMYDDRIELSLGGLSDISYKVSFLKKIIEDKIGPNTSGKLMMLSSGGASFIDSDGLKYNEKKFEQNTAAIMETTSEIAVEGSDETSDKPTESTDSESTDGDS
jgi:hypothetical protein